MEEEVKKTEWFRIERGNRTRKRLRLEMKESNKGINRHEKA